MVEPADAEQNPFAASAGKKDVYGDSVLIEPSDAQDCCEAPVVERVLPHSEVTGMDTSDQKLCEEVPEDALAAETKARKRIACIVAEVKRGAFRGSAQRASRKAAMRERARLMASWGQG